MTTGDTVALSQAADTISTARLVGIYPPLVDAFWQMRKTLRDEGQIIRVAEGLRTWDYQHGLWLKGRHPDGSFVDPIHHTGVVTNADGGHSYHNFGLAVDVDPIEKDGSIDWNASHPQWKHMEEVGIGLGLVSGANWVRIVDAPHFQINGRFPEGAPDDELRSLFKSGSYQAVWDAVSGTPAETSLDIDC